MNRMVFRCDVTYSMGDEDEEDYDIGWKPLINKDNTTTKVSELAGLSLRTEVSRDSAKKSRKMALIA
jgi:hypothetical protein